LGVAIAIVATTTMIFGLVPAFVLLRGKVSTDLRSGERGSSRGARRAYSVIVVGQVALACTLLVSSALLIRTVVKMVQTPTGVNADEVVTTSVQLPGGGFAPGEFIKAVRAQSDTHALLLDRIREQPGVIAAGAANVLPVDIGWRLPFDIDGAPPVRADERRIAQYHTVSDGYFETMGAPLRAGRSFTKFDTGGAPAVVVVNETFTSRYLNGGPAIGRLVITTAPSVGPLGTNLMMRQGAPGQPAPPRSFEIVGVVKDIRNTPLGQPTEPAIYFGSQQFPFRELFYTVKASSVSMATAAVKKALAATTPTVPMGVVRTWGDRMAARTAEPRLLMTLLIFFGAAAALLAALGVYGLFSWSVAQRTRELAIRLTLGARPASVGAGVLRQSLVLIVAGLAAGFVIIRLAEATLARVLFEMSPRDPESLLAAGALLILVAVAACVPPAIRALRVDPVEGLRAE
jgi:putative ABC transport system permease protein